MIQLLISLQTSMQVIVSVNKMYLKTLLKIVRDMKC